MIYNKQFEETVLACLVQDKQFLRESLAVVRPEHFEEQVYGSVCRIILQTYVKTQDTPSRIGLLSALVEAERSRVRAKKGDEEALIIKPCEELIDRLLKPLSSVSDVKFQFLEFCRTKEMELSLTEQWGKLTQGEAQPHEVFENLRRTYQRINTQTQGGRDFFMGLPEMGAEFGIDLAAMHTSGFQSLDKKMGGGVSPGTLTTFIAPPKGGKSMTLLQTAYHNLARMNRTVMHFTHEISESKTARRYVARISNMNYNTLHITENTKRALEECAKFWELTHSTLKIKGYSAGMASCDDLRSYLYWLDSSEGIKPHVVIVDYADELRPSPAARKEQRHDLEVGQIYRELRALADEFKVAIFTASQGTRESLGKTIITMADIADSIKKVAVSDHIISLCKTEAEESLQRARLFFAGSREAETGAHIPVKYCWENCWIQETNEPMPGDQNGRA